MKKVLAIILIILSVLLFSSCSSVFRTASNQSGTENRAEENVIRIGVLESQTGQDAEGGRESVLGVQYAHKKKDKITLNDKKYKVKLIVKDDKSTYDGGKAAALELINEGVCAVIGSYSSKALRGAYEILKEAGIPVISPVYATEYKSSKESHIFSLTPTVYEEVSFVADYMVNTLGISKTAILRDVGDSLSSAYALLFKEAYEKLGGETAELVFVSEAVDYKKLTESVNESKVYAIYAPLSSGKMKKLSESALEYGLAVPVFTTKYHKTNTLKEYLSGKNINVFVPSFLSFASYGEIYVDLTEWIEKDEDRIYLNSGSKATELNLLSYDAYTLVFSAIMQAGSAFPDDIISALGSISLKTGSGEVSFDKNGNRLKFITLIEKTDTK